MPSLHLEDAVDLLANILPARALEDVISDDGLERDYVFREAGITHESIVQLLQSEGVHERTVIRRAVSEKVDAENSAVGIPAYEQVNQGFMGKGNPLYESVRQVVQKKLGELFYS